MRRIVCLLGVLLMCLTLAAPAFAAEDTFVPSISYKDGPEVIEAEMNGEDVTGCVVVTSLKEAKEKTTDIYQEDRDLLWDVYSKLSDGSMELQLDNRNLVVRELVDVSFMKSDCVEAEHGHKEWLAEEDTVIEVVFDLGISRNAELEVLVYINGEWVFVENVKNNGDGTVTCIFDDICPVAFCVDSSEVTEAPKTGDSAGANLMLWGILMAGAFALIVVMVINRRKFIR